MWSVNDGEPRRNNDGASAYWAHHNSNGRGGCALGWVYKLTLAETERFSVPLDSACRPRR